MGSVLSSLAADHKKIRSSSVEPIVESDWSATPQSQDTQVDWVSRR